MTVATEAPTEESTEKPTEKSTEQPTEKVVETESENIIYTPIDHGTVGSGKPPAETPAETSAESKKPAASASSNSSTSNTSKPSSTDSNVMLLAKVIYLEGGNCSEYCQWLIGSTAMNLADERGGLANVAYDYNTFNIAYLIDGCKPSSLSISVAERILSGDRDYKVKAFRMNYYHSFGSPYTNVDNVYFSTY